MLFETGQLFLFEKTRINPLVRHLVAQIKPVKIKCCNQTATPRVLNRPLR